MNDRAIKTSAGFLGVVAVALACGCGRNPHTEERWLVSETTSNIVSMLAVAREPGVTNLAFPRVETRLSSSGPAKATVYHIRVDTTNAQSLEGDVSLEPFVWSPACYVPFTRQVMSSWAISIPPMAGSNDEGVVLESMRELTAQMLQTENEHISSRLATNILDANAHEQAALLLGCFALREAAGSFYDVRQTLCRISAHLSIARVLRGESASSPEGEIANVMLLTFVGRQKDALDAIANLRNQQRNIVGLESWLTALTMRNTGDWRALPAPEKASLVERLECFRALYSRVGSAAAVRMLQESPSEPIPDWGRILMESYFSVEEGHQFAEPSVPSELREVQQVHLAVFGTPLDGTHFAAALNCVPQPCAHRDQRSNNEIQVIDWGMWAQFYQRHICHAVTRTVWFLRDKWAVKEENKAFESDSDRYFKDLDLYPIFIKRRNAETKDSNIPEYENAIAASVRLLKSTPQLVNCDNWTCLRHHVSGSNASDTVPDPGNWFTPSLPSGTCYDSGVRLSELHPLQEASLQLLDQLRSLAPYSRETMYAYCQRKYTKPMTVADVKSEFGEQCEYDLRLMTQIADRSRKDPQAYQQAFAKICALDPNQYNVLGQYFVDNKMPTEAAAAFQKAVDVAPNRVWVANSCRWLVNYYYDHGQRDKALEIAQMAAEVYSGSGLETMAFLMERMGKLDDAEIYFKKILERYDSPGSLFAFYVRQDTAHPDGSYTQRRQRLQGEVFPEGLQRVTLKDFTGAPRDGSAFTTTSDILTYWGLKLGDVVVALDGYRVHSDPQYRAIRDFSDGPKMVVIVWHDGRYKEFTVELEGRRFGAYMGTYTP